VSPFAAILYGPIGTVLDTFPPFLRSGVLFFLVIGHRRKPMMESDAYKPGVGIIEERPRVVPGSRLGLLIGEDAGKGVASPTSVLRRSDRTTWIILRLPRIDRRSAGLRIHRAVWDAQRGVKGSYR
jgi:hypothetical protein